MIVLFTPTSSFGFLFFPYNLIFFSLGFYFQELCIFYFPILVQFLAVTLVLFHCFLQLLWFTLPESLVSIGSCVSFVYPFVYIILRMHLVTMPSSAFHSWMPSYTTFHQFQRILLCLLWHFFSSCLVSIYQKLILLYSQVSTPLVSYLEAIFKVLTKHSASQLDLEWYVLLHIFHKAFKIC